MISERNVVEIVVNIIDIESGPATIGTLQALHPLDRARDRLVVTVAGACPACAVHRHDNDGCVVEVGIMWIGVLERPAARSNIRAACRPVSDDIEYLLRHQPIEPS